MNLVARNMKLEKRSDIYNLIQLKDNQDFFKEYHSVPSLYEMLNLVKKSRIDLSLKIEYLEKLKMINPEPNIDNFDKDDLSSFNIDIKDTIQEYQKALDFLNYLNSCNGINIWDIAKKDKPIAQNINSDGISDVLDGYPTKLYLLSPGFEIYEYVYILTNIGDKNSVFDFIPHTFTDDKLIRMDPVELLRDSINIPPVMSLETPIPFQNNEIVLFHNPISGRIEDRYFLCEKDSEESISIYAWLSRKPYSKGNELDSDDNIDISQGSLWYLTGLSPWDWICKKA